MSQENTDTDAQHSADGDAGSDPFSGMSTEEAHALGQQHGQMLASNYQAVGGGELKSRMDMQRRMGSSTGQYGGSRDMYGTLGYAESISFDDYLTRYIRQDIAQRIVNAPADKTWSEFPELVDDEDREEQSEFEEAVQELKEEAGILEALRNTDRYAGIGHVGALVIGFADGNQLDAEVESGSLPDNVDEAIAYLTPLHEGAIKSITLNDDETSPEFGEPASYRVDFSAMDSLEDSGVDVTNERREREVHADRVIMVQPDRPRLECVFNRLMDLEKVTGASAELFWRGADYGLALNMDAEAAAQMGPEQRRALQEDIEDEAQAYYHGLQPFLQVAGVDVERLGGEDVDPTGVADLILQLISGAIQMPKRILTGSERGELASTQDRANWLGHIGDRQQNWAEPHILRPLIERLAGFDILPDPIGGRYEVEWPNLFELNAVEQAEVMSQKADAFKTASEGLMATPLATEGEVRQEILDWGIEVGSETGEAEGGPTEEPEEVGGTPPIPGDIPDEFDEEDAAVIEEFQRRFRDAELPADD